MIKNLKFDVTPGIPDVRPFCIPELALFHNDLNNQNVSHPPSYVVRFSMLHSILVHKMYAQIK